MCAHNVVRGKESSESRGRTSEVIKHLVVVSVTVGLEAVKVNSIKHVNVRITN